MTSKMKKTLIFTIVSDYDNHSWLSEKSDTDFIIIYNGKDNEKFEKLKSFSLYCIQSKGVKFQLLWSWWIHNRNETKKYDIIGVLDDNLEWDSKKLNDFLNMIKIHLHNRDKSAAAYSPTHIFGKSTKECMKQQKSNHILRKVDEIDMSWVFFERNFLDDFLMNEYEISLSGCGENKLYSFKALKEGKNLYVSDKYSSINSINIERDKKFMKLSGKCPLNEKLWKIIQESKGINLS